MRSSPPPLLPIFRSALQGRLLATRYANPAEESSISDLARRLKAHVATVQREVDRLAEAGILLTRRSGTNRLVRPNGDSPIAEDLSSLVMRSFGPIYILGHLLGTLKGIERALAYGSWAERYTGAEGPAPNDIDVLVIGQVDRERLHAIAQEAEAQIGRPVQLISRTHRSWQQDRSGFAESIRTGATVDIPLAPG